MSSTPLPELAAPARRALDEAGVTSLEGLAWMTRTELEALDGVGANTLRALDAALDAAGLALQPESETGAD